MRGCEAERDGWRFKKHRGRHIGGKEGGEKTSLQKTEKKEAGWWEKEIQVKEANWVFQLLIRPAGLARGYHSKIQHLALWCCCDQMSTGWHKQNKRDWSPFRPDPSCLNPAHVPPSPWIILFLLVFMLVLSVSLSICLCFAAFLIILTEGITISSWSSNLSSCFTVSASLSPTSQLGELYGCIKRRSGD